MTTIHYWAVFCLILAVVLTLAAAVGALAAVASAVVRGRWQSAVAAFGLLVVTAALSTLCLFLANHA